jgi:DNA-binding transcriptional regulator LsrR (DeoR family)
MPPKLMQFTQEQIDKIVMLRYQKRWSLVKIGKEMGCCDATISRILRSVSDFPYMPRVKLRKGEKKDWRDF